VLPNFRAWPYRLASPLLAAYHYVFRPTVRGVRCAIVRDDRVLLVRHTYGDRRWAWPGGLLRRGEDPRDTARREMREELGLDLEDWRALGRVEHVADDRAHHEVWGFLAEVGEIELTLQRAEIAEARWMRLDDVPDDVLEGTVAIARLVRAALAG
jgi:ADP-ribose pyrophosphatase YjhB (NUDIX family)